ncbi:hypothetical protein [Bacillus sp. FSL H8-0512]|uniref:hypothetical protein n=1 Tax=Bacillus sp. FSL H8-0512 TaxID=2921395 RepID=UPI0030F50E50
MENYEKIYQSFWKKILEDEEGNLNIEQVKKELYDYKILLEEVPKVYGELTGFSKAHTRSEAVIKQVNERMIDKNDAFDDLTTNAENGKVILTVDRLKDYFDIRT